MLPVILFVLVSAALGVGLTLDPRIIPSALIDKPVPEFKLPPVGDRTEGLTTDDLKKGNVTIVNVFASWCGPCRIEHPLLMEIANNSEIAIHGINYKDRPRNVINWLHKYGNPYKKIGSDQDGRVSIDWGVYGVPETFVIDQHARIAYKHVGPLSAEDMKQKILPLLQELQAR